MNKIITISREFGSGGREFAKRLADELGFSYYDKEIISEIAKESNLNEEYIENVLNSDIVNQFNYTFAHSFTNINQVNTSVEIFNLQNNILKSIAKKGNCVIVGRAADVILEEYNPFKIFIYASDEYKLQRVKEKELHDNSCSNKDVLKMIKKIDKTRASNYELISCKTWGDKSNYDLCINTSNLDIKVIVKQITNYVSEYFK